MAPKRKAAKSTAPPSKAKRVKISSAEASTTPKPTRKTRSARSTRSVWSASLPFFDLPFELREKIYTAYFTFDDLPPNCHRGCLPGCSLHNQGFASLLFVSRQFHNEIWPYYTAHRTFIFDNAMQMANKFLSFLPSQRLLSLKHLALRFNPHDHDASTFVADFQRIWWYYLDVFARLESLTIESVSSNNIPTNKMTPFYQLIQPLIRLLEQGCPKKPRSVSPGATSLLSIQSKNLPASHDWVMQIGAMHKTKFGGGNLRDSSVTSHRIVIRRHEGTTYRQHSDLFGKWSTWAEGLSRLTRKTPKINAGPCQYHTQDFRSVGHKLLIIQGLQSYNISWSLVECSFDLGVDTEFSSETVAPISHMWLPSFFTTRLITISGRWSNVHDLL